MLASSAKLGIIAETVVGHQLSLRPLHLNPEAQQWRLQCCGFETHVCPIAVGQGKTRPCLSHSWGGAKPKRNPKKGGFVSWVFNSDWGIRGGIVI